MKVIVNFGEKKVVVPCGIDGDLSIRELIHIATIKYCKLSYNNGSILNSEQVQLRLNNGAVVDPDDRVCDVADDREELFAIIDSQSLTYPFHAPMINSNGELSSSMTSSNLSSSLSEHDRLIVPTLTNRHEVIVTDADLRTRSLRVKNDPQQIKMPQRTNRDEIDVNEQTGEKIFSIKLPKENSPLGIHVIPFDDNEQQVNGLRVQNIESDGRIQKHGILQINDRIIEINRINIEKCSFDKAQLIFRTALLEPILELCVARKIRSTLSEINFNSDHDPNMNSLNTRKLGKIIRISLIKGHDGLGFKLASRDNPTGLANPIYVKTIFPKGAAIDDGRLQRGDRLLAVNSIDITQMSLQETVCLLRDTRIGETVELSISRQTDFNNDSVTENSTTNINETKPQIMTFDIPLNDTSSAGLGITLKGKTSIIDGKSIDFGIFVKSILTGGAASRDNRLRSNDQILVINDLSLSKLSNLEAATTLHEAVRREIHPGFIKITISRVLYPVDDSLNYVKEIDLSPLPLLNPINNDENELDLTTFVPPPLTRKPPTQHSNRSRLTDVDVSSSSPRSTSLSTRSKSKGNEQQSSDDVDSNSCNPFDRETPFRQSVSEKRRLTNQPNKQILQWKQRSFHDSRTQPERKSYPMSSTVSMDILTPVIDISDDDDDPNDLNEADDECRYSVSKRAEQPIGLLPDTNLVRSSSFESLQERKSPKNDDEKKRQAKLRSRACNDSFRQAVDKSYGQQTIVDNDDGKFTKIEKQKFRFTNLFSSKSKRKDQQDENRSSKSFNIPPEPRHHSVDHYQPQSQGYQPYRFDSSTSNEHFPSQRYESQLVHTFQPKTISSKSSHSSIPRQFYHMNLNGSQSLKQHQTTSHATILPPSTTYPSTFVVQPTQFTSYSHNFDKPIQSSQQQIRRTNVYSSSSRNFFHLESPANV